MEFRMPTNVPVLFLVVDQTEERVLYHCHSLIELFNLKEYHGVDSSARVFRYTRPQAGNKCTELFALFDVKHLKWEICDEELGIGFQRISFEEVRKGYEFVKRLRKNKS